MFSFTIAEFTFLCVGFAFVGSLILFPSFRQQLKALAGGFVKQREFPAFQPGKHAGNRLDD